MIGREQNPPLNLVFFAREGSPSGPDGRASTGGGRSDWTETSREVDMIGRGVAGGPFDWTQERGVQPDWVETMYAP